MSGFRAPWRNGGAPAGGDAPPVRRLPLVLAGVLVAICAIIFAVIMHSMWTTLREESGSTRYDLLTGKPITVADVTLMNAETTYVAITAVTLDEGTLSSTFRISGHRICSKCDPMTLQLFALDRNPDDWWGLPPSDSVKLPEETAPFTEILTLPVSGLPQR